MNRLQSRAHQRDELVTDGLKTDGSIWAVSSPINAESEPLTLIFLKMIIDEVSFGKVFIYYELK